MPEKDELTHDSVQTDTFAVEGTITSEVPQKTSRTIAGLYLDAEELERSLS